MTKDQRIAKLKAALTNLTEAARAAVSYEAVASERWQPVGTRRSKMGNLERAVSRAELVLGVTSKGRATRGERVEP